MTLPKVKMNNEMMIRDLMNNSPFGALGQVFIVEAVRYYSEQVAASPAVPYNGDGLDPAVWKKVAEDVSGRLKENYEESITYIGATNAPTPTEITH